MNEFPEYKVRVMLHALGIANLNNGRYIQPNTRYSPYPTSHRNHFQESNNSTWDELVELGYARYIDSEHDWMRYYYVTEEGEEWLKKIGYKWHPLKKKKSKG